MYIFALKVNIINYRTVILRTSHANVRIVREILCNNGLYKLLTYFYWINANNLLKTSYIMYVKPLQYTACDHALQVIHVNSH